MDYSKFTDTIIDDVKAAVALINNPEIAPEVRQLNQEILFREVGAAVYNKIYNMNAWDMEVPHTTGNGVDPQRYYGLAKVASNSISTGKLGLDEYIRNYIASAISQAQGDAMRMARQSGKKPTVTRTEGRNACKWCRSLTGTFTDPPREVFMRHGGCGGKIVTSGYNSRNGTLNNYKNGNAPVRNPAGGSTPVIDSKGNQVVYRGTGAGLSGVGNVMGNALYVSRYQSIASKYGTTTKLSLPLKAKDILQITSDIQLDKIQYAAQKWAVKARAGYSTAEYLPAYIRHLGYKAVEIAPTVDPFAGIAIVDPKIIAALQKQLK